MFFARAPVALSSWRWLLAVLLVGGRVATGSPALEAGRPFLQNFGLRDYHAHNQNWAAVQDDQGIMYFGNKGVVLAYDGVTWDKIEIPRTAFVRGLAIDAATGVVFVGAVDELGYLHTAPDGEKTFVSLLPQLPAEARACGGIRRMFATAEGIVFVAEQQVMRWHDGHFRVWKLPNATMIRSFLVNGELIVQHPDLGLLRLEGDRFVSVSTDPIFRRAQVTLCVAGSTASDLVLGTTDDGLFTLRGDGTASPLANDTAAFLKANKIRRGARLRDGSLAIATYTGGLVVLDHEGRFRAQIDEAAGLQNEFVFDMFEDRENGLWLCLNSGVTRVEFSSPLTVFDPANGLRHTTVHAMPRIGGVLYLGTNYGIYRVVPADPGSARMARCELLADFKDGCWDIVACERGFVAVGPGGVTLFDGDGRHPRPLVKDVDPSFIRHSRADPARLFYGALHGLGSLRYDASTDRWVDEGFVPGADVGMRSVVETSPGDFWLGTADHGIYRITFAPGATAADRGTPSVSHYFAGRGLPTDQEWTRVVPWSGEGGVLFSTQGGLYRFDAKAQTFLAVPTYGTRFSDDTFGMGEVTEDAAGNLWLAGRPKSPDGWANQELGHATPVRGGAEAVFHPLPYKIADRIGEIEKFFVEETPEGRTVWVCGTDGAVRVETDQREKTPTASFPTLIRRAFTTAENQPAAAPQSMLGRTLPYARNSVRFEFAADTFAFGADVRYQTRLGGFGNGDWSDYTTRTVADYTNLPEGDYVFETRARNSDGQLGTMGRFPFRILAPWQRTPEAFAVYGLLALAAVFGIVRWQSRSLHRQNVRLENLVAARTDELRAHEHELVRAKESADTANRSKSAFLANMSHELRTPLNAILGYTQIMLKDVELGARNRERLTVVNQSGGHLLAVINEVLDLSKIEAGKQTLNQTDFFLGQLLDEVCAVFRPRLAEKGLEFRYLRPPTLPRCVHTDADKLRQVLFNLLGNAVKFTQRGEVRFEVSSAGGDRVRFEVMDTGIGIAEEEVREVFVAFHQVGGHGLTAQGTGLGLAISQRFVEMLGGRLEVESALGRGSRFWFEFSLPSVMTESAPSLAGAIRDSPRPVTGFHGPPRRLLIVDDDAVVRRVLCELLEPLGFEIEEARNGEECLEHCAQHAPEVLLLDLRMAGLDGFGVARQLRQNGSSVKIIAVSASVFESDRQQAIAAGCDDFLPKPFKEETLLATLRRLLGVEWIYGPPIAVGSSAADGSSHEAAPPPEEIDAMLELSRRGDILGIKKRLGVLQAAGEGGCPSFVRGLEPLVAGYQMDRIRDVLVKCKQNGNA